MNSGCVPLSPAPLHVVSRTIISKCRYTILYRTREQRRMKRAGKVRFTTRDNSNVRTPCQAWSLRGRGAFSDLARIEAGKIQIKAIQSRKTRHLGQAQQGNNRTA